jgi:hypothetical protein
MFRTAYRRPFRLLGIPIHLDVSFVLILPFLAWVIGFYPAIAMGLLGFWMFNIFLMLLAFLSGGHGRISNRSGAHILKDASAWEVFQEMSRHKFGRLMVVDSGGKLSGIISEIDLIRAIQVRTVGSLLEKSPTTA